MEWDKALAELRLREPEIRSWLGLDPRPRDVSLPSQADPLPSGDVDRPPVRAFSRSSTRDRPMKKRMLIAAIVLAAMLLALYGVIVGMTTRTVST